MKDIATLLHEPDSSVAIVGATDNSQKYGNTIYLDLKRKGFKIFPVNPTRDTVDGDKAFPSLGDIPEKPTIVNIVTPPEVTLDVLKDCLELELMNAWIQPGAESPEVLGFLKEHKFNYLVNACIMIQSH